MKTHHSYEDVDTSTWGSFVEEDTRHEATDEWGSWEPDHIGAAVLRQELRPDLEHARQQRVVMAGLSLEHKYNLDHAFKSVDPDYDIPEEIRERKIRSEKEIGKPLLWPEWLAASNGATDEDMAALITWDVNRQEAMAQDTAIQERLASFEKRFAAGLESAVHNNTLHPQLLENYRNMPSTHIRLAGMFEDMQYLGLAYNDDLDDGAHEIVLSRDGNVTQHVITHEYLHSYGALADHNDLGGAMWNEAAIDEAASIIDRYTPDVDAKTDNAKGYADYKDVFNAARAIGDMSLYDITGIMANAAARGERADFLETVSQRAGIDMKATFRRYKARYEKRAEEPLTQRDLAYSMAHRFAKIAAARQDG